MSDLSGEDYLRVANVADEFLVRGCAWNCTWTIHHAHAECLICKPIRYRVHLPLDVFSTTTVHHLIEHAHRHEIQLELPGVR